MLYIFAEKILAIVEYETICIFAILPIIFIILNRVYTAQFDLKAIALLFILLPVATPVMTTISGFEYFTAMNKDIQTRELIVSGLILILLFALSISVGAKFKSKIVVLTKSPFYVGESFFIFVILLNLGLLLNFLEGGNIIFSDYGTLKNTETPFSSLVQQFFNLSFSCLISSCGTKRRKKLIKISIIMLIIFALIVSKRNLVVGLGIIYLYLTTGGNLTRKQIIYLIIGTMLLYFIGQVRSVGILNYFNGTKIAALEYYSSTSGGANIFLSTIGSIHLNLSGNLDQWEKYPLLLIFNGITQGNIYESHGYAYNGGMHLATTLYWNFGLMGVVIGGLAIGRILTLAHQNLSQLGGNYSGGSSLAFFITLSLLLSSIIWYGPLGIIKAGAALFLFGLVLKVFSRTKVNRI